MMGSLLLAAMSIAAPVPKEPLKKELGLVGEWKTETFTAAGIDEPKPDEPDVSVFDSEGKFFHRKGLKGKMEERGTYTIDKTAEPMTIDLKSNERGGSWRGIFKIEDDTLTICATFLSDAPRPTTFEAPKDKIQILIVFKRVKKQ
jgi:uncharacterized protein (TIGR03067 family)